VAVMFAPKASAAKLAEPDGGKLWLLSKSASTLTNDWVEEDVDPFVVVDDESSERSIELVLLLIITIGSFESNDASGCVCTG
jgi:hypothetical protein